MGVVGCQGLAWAVLAVGLLCSAVPNASATPTAMFTPDEMKKCYRFRTPNIAHVPSPDGSGPGLIHVVTRCCGANLCSEKSTQDGEQWHNGRVNNLGDNIKDCKVAFKSSFDGGQTWNGIRTASPHGESGYGNAAWIYDAKLRRLVLQYQYVPAGLTAPTFNTTYYQRYMSPNATKWSNPVDITPQLRGCNPDIHNMQDQSAGNKLQTDSGRLIFAGHNHKHQVCVWYSDDGGETYTAAKLLQGNEISIATDVSGGDNLLMNGRPVKGVTEGRRSRYTSGDDGSTWSSPSPSALPTDDGSACERALINVNGVLYTSEPQGDKRTKMVVSCSKDGVTWPHSIVINGDNPGGYSDLTALPDGNLLMVWEDSATGNMWSETFGTSWCS